MIRIRLIVAGAVVGLAAGFGPAHAGSIGDTGFFSYWFHRYGEDDVNRPALTDDRPYWHGDDAVPPAMRWHDRDIEVVDQYGITIATQVPLPPEVMVADSPPSLPSRPIHRRTKRRHGAAGSARRNCPAPLASAVTLPPVPAPTEH